MLSLEAGVASMGSIPCAMCDSGSRQLATHASAMISLSNLHRASVPTTYGWGNLEAADIVVLHLGTYDE
jgi:hypothetical protein